MTTRNDEPPQTMEELLTRMRAPLDDAIELGDLLAAYEAMGGTLDNPTPSGEAT